MLENALPYFVKLNITSYSFIYFQGRNGVLISEDHPGKYNLILKKSFN